MTGTGPGPAGPVRFVAVGTGPPAPGHLPAGLGAMAPALPVKATVPSSGPELVGELPSGAPGVPEGGLGAYALARYDPGRLGREDLRATLETLVLLRVPGPPGEGGPDAAAPRSPEVSWSSSFEASAYEAVRSPGMVLWRLGGIAGAPPEGWASEEALGLVRRAARRAIVLHGAVELLSLSEHLSPGEIRDAVAMASVLEVMRR